MMTTTGMSSAKPLAYLEAMKSSHPQYAAMWAEFEELYTKKLWHQLTLRIDEFLVTSRGQVASAGQGGAAAAAAVAAAIPINTVDLYNQFILDFEMKISPLKLVEILAYVYPLLEPVAARGDFLLKTKEKVKGDKEAALLCDIFRAQTLLAAASPADAERIREVKNLVEDLGAQLDEQIGVTAANARYYLLAADYFKVTEDHAAYYRAALRYLGCLSDPMEEIQPAARRVELAVMLSMAALLGEGVYNFGELLAHPILGSLAATEHSWLVDLLYAFNSGDVGGLDKLRPRWSSQPDLVKHETFLRQKISLLCLMELTFRAPAAGGGVLPFATVAAAVRLPEDEVEMLVMRALSLELVRGTIDEVAREVTLTWVQPRVLDKAQLGTLKGKLETWCRSISGLEGMLEAKARDILA